MEKKTFQNLWDDGVSIWKRVPGEDENAGSALGRFWPGKRFPDKSATYLQKTETGIFYAFEHGPIYVLAFMSSVGYSSEIRVNNKQRTVGALPSVPEPESEMYLVHGPDDAESFGPYSTLAGAMEDDGEEGWVITNRAGQILMSWDDNDEEWKGIGI